VASASGVDQEELAVRRDQRRPCGALGLAQREQDRPRPHLQRLQQPRQEAVGELPRPRAQQVEPARPQHRDRGRHGLGGQHDVGVDEHQHPAAGRGRELGAGVRLARQAGRGRPAGQDPYAGVARGRRAHHVGGAVGGTVVQDEDLQVGVRRVGPAANARSA
jgi:hypothetical protein